MTTEASGCSRLDGRNAQVQDSGEQPVARYTSKPTGGNQPLRKGERRKVMEGSPEDSMLKAETELRSFREKVSKEETNPSCTVSAVMTMFGNVVFKSPPMQPRVGTKARHPGPESGL